MNLVFQGMWYTSSLSRSFWAGYKISCCSSWAVCEEREESTARVRQRGVLLFDAVSGYIESSIQSLASSLLFFSLSTDGFLDPAGESANGGRKREN